MFREMDLINGLENSIVKWGNLNAGELLLIITDTMVSEVLINAMAAVAKSVGAEVTIMITEPKDLPHQEPNKAVSEAMKAADLIVGCMYISISHTAATFEAAKAGTRYLYIGPNLEAMAAKSAKFPPEIIFAAATKIARMWKQGKTLTLTCEKGTHLTAGINPDNVIGEEGAGAPQGTRTIEGKVRRSRFAVFEGGFGTVGLWPEWTANGTVYFDAAHTFVGVLKTPLKAEIKDGRLIHLEGDPEVVSFFDGIFDRFGDDARHIGEIMMGLNPWVDVIAGLKGKTHNYAHRAAGTVHVCFGNSIDDFRTVRPGIHLDQFMIRPTLKIDEKLCIDQGRVVLYDDDEEMKDMFKKFGIDLRNRSK